MEKVALRLTTVAGGVKAGDRLPQRPQVDLVGALEITQSLQLSRREQAFETGEVKVGRSATDLVQDIVTPLGESILLPAQTLQAWGPTARPS